MTWTDSQGYRCCTPPVWMRITAQHKHYPQTVLQPTRLPDAELAATIDYVVEQGHSVVEAAAKLGRHPTSIATRLRNAGYGYNAAIGHWEGIWAKTG